MCIVVNAALFLGGLPRPHVLHSFSFHLRLSRKEGLCEAIEHSRLKEPLLLVRLGSDTFILSSQLLERTNSIPGFALVYKDRPIPETL